MLVILTAPAQADAARALPAPPQQHEGAGPALLAPRSNAPADARASTPPAAGRANTTPQPGAAGDATEPPLMPSGMDLLYSDHVAFDAAGEPIVTVGLMTHQKQIVISSKGPMQVDYYEHGVLKRTTTAPGAQIAVTIRRAQPAHRAYYVDVDGVPWNDRARLQEALEGWRARGYAHVEVLEEGMVLGIGGRVLDNREYRIALPTPDATTAQQLASEVYSRFGQHGTATSRLVERPWAELNVRLDGAPLGLATSYVRVTSPTPNLLQVGQVEFGKGYSWHGFANRHYHGEIYAVVDSDGTLAAVNVIGVEQMLAGVVPSEIFPSAPAAALEAQAVAARNTLLSQLGRRHHTDPFHLCSAQHCQVYTGADHEDPRTTAAVQATAGEALFWHGKLVNAVYSASCGGHTENNEVVWGGDPDPALRGVPDFDVKTHPELARFAHGIDAKNIAAWVTSHPETYCSQASLARPGKFRWQRSFDAATLNRLVGAVYPHLGRLRQIEVDGRGPGGKVMSLHLVGEHSETTVQHELPVRRLFGNLNSGTFIMRMQHDAAGFITHLTFIGAGWGHGVGMCQLGAIGRAEAHQTYRQILAHYYNGAQVERLY